MDGERSVIHNTVMVIAVTIPGVIISVVTALLLWGMKAILCVVKCGKAFVHRELDLFSQLHEQKSASAWDDKGLFLAFIKGEDVHGRRENPSKLRLEPEKNTKARINDGNGMLSTTKCLMSKELFITNLFLRKPCAHFRFSAGFCCGISVKSLDSNSCDNKTADCVFADASKADFDHQFTDENRIGTDAKQLRTGNGSEYHCEITTAPNLWIHQAKSTAPEENRYQDTKDACSHEAVLTQDSSDNKVTFHEIVHSSFGANKIKKRDKEMSFVNFIQLNEDKKASLQVERRSSFPVDSVTSAYCTSQVDIGNKEISPRTGRSCPGVNKSNKRRKRSTFSTPGCPNQTEVLEKCAKKTRKDPISAHRRHKIPVSSFVRKMIKDKTGKKIRAKVSQRKVMEWMSRTDIPFVGQLGHMIGRQAPAVARMDQEPSAVERVLGEQVTAKRPLPVTALTVGLSEEPMDTCHEVTPTTPSILELVSLMEQLQIAPYEDPVCDDGEFYAYSDDDCDAKYNLYPELQSLPEQVLQLIQLLA